MVMQYLQKAMGDGDLSSSVIFQETFNWLIEKIVGGKVVEKEDFHGLQTTTYTRTQAPRFDMSKYELLHDFLNNEYVSVPTTDYNTGEPSVETVSFSEGLAEVVKESTYKWLMAQEGLTGAEKQALQQFSQFITAGMLTEIFKLNIREGQFELEFIKRCDTPERESHYQSFYGTRKAVQAFPQSTMKGKWLEEDLGL